MKAMILKQISRVEDMPLKLEDVAKPEPSHGEILVKICACGICRTELDEIEGRRVPKLPIILGHEIVGRIEALGSHVRLFNLGDRVGIAWIYSACGKCDFCLSGQENLCEEFQATGCDVNGGYAEYIKVKEDFAFNIPENFNDLEAAPLLCAGAIGYRALKLTGLKDGETIGLFGFGASAHQVYQIIRHLYPRTKIFVFTRRKGDMPSLLAREMGADWVGETGEAPPEKLHRAIDTTPVGQPIIEALNYLEKGGRLVINVIRKEELIPQMKYEQHLWYEKEIKSVANITRKDVQEFLNIAAEVPIIPKIREFKLEEANKALLMLKRGEYHGAGVLKIG
ncbi:MAG: zinc-dependent alcohol dehydrogenase family protein [Nitrososphaeria archaeon]|nr:zinc-dependent alcohol dehydrogenase family protein [Nitrososphaeria archaeon]